MQMVQTRGLQPIAVALLFFFTWSHCRLWAFGPVTPDAPAQQPAPSTQTHVVLEHYAEVLRVLHRTVIDVERRLTAGENIALDLAQVQEHRKRLEAVDTDIRAQFQTTEDRLKAAGVSAEILVRHQQMVAHYGPAFEKLRGTLRRVEQLQSALQAAQHGKDPERIEASYEALKQLVTMLKASMQDAFTEPPHIPLDPNNLPHRTPTVKERQPRLQKEDFTELHQPIQLAFLGEPSSLLLAQAASALPVPQDLAETPEVAFTQAIQDLAAQLDHQPIKIYEYVRNNFNFEPTYGSIKGAQETLLTKSGNAVDLASLLIALLRASGVPARYVMGTVAMPIASVMNWLGVQDPATANRVLTSGGIPAVQLVQEGVVTHMQLEHAWVTAYVDYVPSRGADHQAGDTWVEFDPAFKQFARTAGLDLNQVVPLNAEQLVNELLSTGTVNTSIGYATGFDQALVIQRLEERRQAVTNFFLTTMPNATIGDILGTETIVTQEIGILPASLPYYVLVRGGAVAEIPDSLRHKVQFQVPGFTMVQNLATLAGTRITLAYVPASDQDRLIIEAHANQPTLPAYLIHVRPVLRLNGVDIAAGIAVQLGQDQQFRMEFTQPFGGKDVTHFRVTAGAYYSIGLDLQMIPAARVAQIRAEVERVQNSITTTPDAAFTSDETVGLLLQVAIMGFWAEGDILETVLARLMKVRSFRPTPGAGITALGLAVNKLFGTPITVRVNGTISLDVRRSVHAVHSIINDVTTVPAFVRASGLLRSQLEASVLEQLFGASDNQAASTTVVLQVANQSNVPIFRIDHTNVNQIVQQQLQLAQPIKQDIINSVHSGKVVTIPQQEVTIGLWRGTGYLIEDPHTGAAAYLISGGIAGGEISLEELAIRISLIIADISIRYSIDQFGPFANFIAGLLRFIFGVQELFDLQGQFNETDVGLYFLLSMLFVLAIPLVIAIIAPGALTFAQSILVALVIRLLIETLNVLFFKFGIEDDSSRVSR